MDRKKEAWATMEAYNKQDVLLLERVYDRLLPWITNHPNLSAHGDTFCCPKCGSVDYQQRGYAIQLGGKYRRYQCKPCGGWFRLNLREPPKQKLKAIAA
jgi:hypothetical protein